MFERAQRLGELCTAADSLTQTGHNSDAWYVRQSPDYIGLQRLDVRDCRVPVGFGNATSGKDNIALKRN